jgi:poly-beta-1,6-N-acetyl-D-glucosamine synthase
VITGYSLLVYIVWFLSTYFIIVSLLTLHKNKKKLYDSPSFEKKDMLPNVSIVISAYNEEKKIADSLESLKNLNYPKSLYEVIVVNDGSIDKTRDIVLKYLGEKNISFIDNLKNKGKAACLNQGIKIAKGDYVACMDADSVVPGDILQKTTPYFKDKKVGAVTVSVEVKNVDNFLQKIIQLEYLMGLSLFLRVLSFFNCVNVTPGPFSIYKKSLLKMIGYFDKTNITEDLEIAYRIHKSGYKIANCMNTSVKTITPHNVRSLYRQRRRWYSGALMTFWQHKGMLLKRKTKVFTYFIPFNFTLITFGLFLFLLSTYLTFSNAIKNLYFYSFTNYNFLSNFYFNFDLLSLSVFTLFWVFGLVGTIIVVTVGLKAIKNSPRRSPSVYFGYFFLFFMYQAFWLASFFLVIFRRKVRW